MANGRAGALLGRLFTGAMSLGLGVVLLYWAVPPTVAELVALPGKSVVFRIQKGLPVTERELELMVETREQALDWTETGRLYTDLGLGELLLAEKRGDENGFDPTLLGRAIVHLEAGLAKAPARPYVWTRLAYAKLISEGPSIEVAQSLERALALAPYEPRLLLPRLELCLLAWAFLSVKAQDAVLEQARNAWAKSPKRLVELARHTEQPNVIRRALLSSLEDLAAFNRLYREARKQHESTG